MTTAELAVLSLLAEQRRHGYEIEELIETRGLREWTDIGFSSIYYLLKKLEEAGMIASEREAAPRGPARRVYHILPAGMDALREQSLRLLSTPIPAPQPLLLGLANFPLLPPDQVIAALESYEAALCQQRQRIDARRAAQRPLPDFVEALFDYSLVTLDAQIEWLRAFLASLRQSADKPKEAHDDRQD